MADKPHIRTLGKIFLMHSTFSGHTIHHESIAKVQMKIRLIVIDVAHCLFIPTRASHVVQVRIGNNGERKGAARCSLGMERVLVSGHPG